MTSAPNKIVLPHSIDSITFLKKNSISYNLLLDPNHIDNVSFLTICEFKLFLKNFITDLKKVKINYFNNLIEQLISVYAENETRNEHTDILSKLITATTIIITDLPSNVFLKKLKINKFTDNIDYLILPNFILWDHNFIIFLNKAFNSKHDNGLVDISSAIQKIKLTHGVIKDQLQSKNGYAGQFLYSTFLNTASFYANVQCLNAANLIIPPKASIKRYYGRDVDNIKAWTTRHPNISQLNTQVSNVIESQDYTDWNLKAGMGMFPGANTDCDGDKKVITYLPKPNSLIDLECLLYGDPKYSFICFDKNRLSFVSQQIYYLYKNKNKLNVLFKTMPVVNKLWNNYGNVVFAKKLNYLLRDCALVLSSNLSYLLFNRLCSIIADEEMVCGDEELENLAGQFVDVIECGAKGSYNLINSTKLYKQTKTTDMDVISQRAIKSLNTYISSHNRVKVGGGDIYHNTTVLQNVYIKNNMICYKNDNCQLADITVMPDKFLFLEHLLDLYLE
ncbi:late expression factor 9 [Ectropis obliqua nucleopolyhedrovirus]|uniref:Late expression factor 9 n=3 Tax=Alphabaculovirus TaxID=558016 RepID=A0EYU9_9ABAC|nr:late expression factor 9 [Ectropis obliqua nucleopolyhedrovirus]ABI35729.1 late expression factor 9 [Ectropis obliqua nucleopolyhedrovirus]AGS47903.1 late expression factor 9 [Ectropis obliqua nucleopolyhedrovirus]QWV59685.1 late expression factor 9 [Ectropis obliqua nucleopolyhedrovirus]UYO72844.1 late expression factor 9 [Ectropis obliqua nucleopolyhedrovirus]